MIQNVDVTISLLLTSVNYYILKHISYKSRTYKAGIRDAHGRHAINY